MSVKDLLTALAAVIFVMVGFEILEEAGILDTDQSVNFYSNEDAGCPTETWRNRYDQELVCNK